MHFVYKYCIPRIVLGGYLSTIAAKLVFAQTFSTLSVTIMFYLFMATLQREPLLAEAKVKLLPTYKKHLKYMSPMVMASFTIIPYDFRAPFMSSCQIPWNSFLSYMKNCKLPDQDFKLVDAK